MESIKQRWLEMHGYTPEDSEIISAWRDGDLTLSNAEEDSILEYLEVNNLN